MQTECIPQRGKRNRDQYKLLSSQIKGMDPVWSREGMGTWELGNREVGNRMQEGEQWRLRSITRMTEDFLSVTQLLAHSCSSLYLSRCRGHSDCMLLPTTAVCVLRLIRMYRTVGHNLIPIHFLQDR